MASALDQYRELIAECCARGDNDAKIVRGLSDAGCAVGRERIRTWIRQETEAGRLPTRKPSGRGRPPVRRSTDTPPPPPASKDTVSPTQSTPPSETENYNPTALADTFGIPIDPSGALDLLGWARLLGTQRVQRVSELELFLIEALQNPWRDHPAKWTKPWVESVRKSAKIIGEHMLEAAEMHELTLELKAQ